MKIAVEPEKSETAIMVTPAPVAAALVVCAVDAKDANASGSACSGISASKYYLEPLTGNPIDFEVNRNSWFMLIISLSGFLPVLTSSGFSKWS